MGKRIRYAATAPLTTNAGHPAALHRCHRIQRQREVQPSASPVTALRDLGGDLGLLQLAKQDGQTVVEGQVLLDEPAWHWPGGG